MIADRTARNIGVFAALSALTYTVLLGMRPYPGDFALKAAMCVLLAGVAWRHAFRLFAVALLFSATGDALLAGRGDGWFVPGLAAFLATHLLYAGIFLRDTRMPRVALRGPRALVAIVIVVFAAAYGAYLAPRLGALALPVLAYIGAIVAMALLSLRIAAVAVPAGAILFMVSDSLLAFDKFVSPAAWMSAPIWMTYAAAQLGIAYGILARPAR